MDVVSCKKDERWKRKIGDGLVYISLEHWPAATLEAGSSVTSDMAIKLTIVDVDERYRSRELNSDEGLGPPQT